MLPRQAIGAATYPPMIQFTTLIVINNLFLIFGMVLFMVGISKRLERLEHPERTPEKLSPRTATIMGGVVLLVGYFVVITIAPLLLSSR